jgi:single-strand DNA-binding protein
MLSIAIRAAASRAEESSMEAYLTVNGHIGGEVELRRTQQGNIARATFRLACTPRVHRQGNWTDDPTTWLTVICWRSLAEHVTDSLAKGDPVIVVGKVRTQAWTDDDGPHERMVIEAATVGHDLTRGTARFRKVQRPDAQPAEPEPADTEPDQDREEVAV